MCWIGNADALDRQLVLDRQHVVQNRLMCWIGDTEVLGVPTGSCAARSARSRPPASGGRSRTAARPSPGRRPRSRRGWAVCRPPSRSPGP
eukprot:15123527-Alexandrium_andersonii.AAC.1